jgi:hypothetical protein
LNKLQDDIKKISAVRADLNIQWQTVKNNANAVPGIQSDFYAVQRYKDTLKQTSIPMD